MVEIKLDNSSEKKPSTKLFGLKEKLGRQKMQDLEENSVLPFEWFKVSEISIHEAMTKKLQDGCTWNIRLGVKHDNKRNQCVMSFEQLKKFQFLCSSKDATINARPLLNYLRPFYNIKKWQISELNSELKLLHVNVKKEEETLKKFLDLYSQIDLTNIDESSLRSFKEFCLEAICSFDAKTQDSEVCRL